MAKGPTIMRGYYRNPEATAKALDVEGWLHTGDLGHIDEDGHLVIDGRMEETFKTSQGEFVIPVPIEQKLTESELIEMAMVIGDNLPYPAALLFPNKEVIEALKEKTKANHFSEKDFLESSRIKEKVEKLIANVNDTLDEWQKLRSYRFILKIPSIEEGELTPTLKLRRGAIKEKYRDLIDEIYQENLHFPISIDKH